MSELEQEGLPGDGIPPVAPVDDHGTPSGRSRARSVRRRATDVLAARWVPIACTAVILAVGLAYLLLWGPVVDHEAIWVSGGDLWGVFRAAHYVGWGDLGGVYTAGNGVNSLPGMPILLSPLAMVSSGLGLSESNAALAVPHPGAALLLAPAELLLASTVLFPLDAMAVRLGVGRGRRAALCVVASVVIWPVAAVWGHAEDPLALTFAVCALSCAFDRSWARCGWLFGLGIVVQPLVALLLPLLLALSPTGQRFLLVCRATVISVFVLVVAAMTNPSGVYQDVVQQPTPPALNHATPWASLAPVVFRGRAGVAGGVLPAVRLPGVPPPHAPMVVELSGGAGRLLDLVVAVLVGVWVWRRRETTPQQVVWAVAVVLASRCLFEAVMTPYYLAPPLVVVLLSAATLDRRRFVATAVLALEVTVFAYHHLSPWVWWLPVVTVTVAVLGLSRPDLEPGDAGDRPVEVAPVGDGAGDGDGDGDGEPSSGRPGRPVLVG